MLTAENRANLEKLATYLEALPADYRHFEMSNWTGHGDPDAIVHYALNNGGVPQCGTVACAVGHGPAAGILVPERMIRQPAFGMPKRVDWWAYCNLFAYEESREFAWMFHSKWSGVDNTPHGAAARIRYVLKKRTPPNGFDCPEKGSAKWLAMYAPYRIDAKALADA